MAGLRGELEELLEAVRRGDVEPDAALERLRELPYRDLGFARVDTHRELRQGAPEAVLAEGKTPEEVGGIVRALVDGGAGSVLVTRADAAACVLYASEAAMQVAHQAVQAMGGTGFMNETPVSRIFRDAKLMEIGAGTSEIRRMLIGRELMKATA